MDFTVRNYVDIQTGILSGINGFLNLFGDISNGATGDIIINDGAYWVKSSQKKTSYNNVFINYKGVTNDVICKVINKTNEAFEYILYVKGYLKLDNNDNIRIDFSFIISPNGRVSHGFSSGIDLFTYSFFENDIFIISLSQNSIYGLEFIARPFNGKADNLHIQFDISDKSKYYTYLP